MLKKLKLLILASFLVAPLILSPIRASAATTVSITSPTSGEEVTGTSFTVTGTATADRKITVSVNGDEVGTTTSDGSGDWSLEVTGQDAGAKTIEATASVSYAYVANTADATISVINAVTNEKIGSNISSGVNQTGVTIKPDGTQMVTTSGYGVGNTIKVWSLANPEVPVVTHTLTASGGIALGAFYTPDGQYFYVTSEEGNFSAGYVTRYLSADPTTSAAVTGYDQNLPANVSFKSDSSRAYVGNVVSSTMSVINVSTNTQISTFTGGGGGGGGPLMSDNIHGYSLAGGSNAARPYNVDAGTFGSAISVGSGPRVGILNQAQDNYIVSNYSSDTLSVIDTNSNTVVSSPSTGAGSNPFGLAFSNDFSRLYVVENALDRVSVRNPSTYAVASNITVGDSPGTITLGPVESASTSVDFTLTAASSSSADETLADTGQNTYLYFALASCLLIAPAVYLRKRFPVK